MKSYVNKIFVFVLLLCVLFVGCSTPQKQSPIFTPESCIYYKGTKGLYAEDRQSGVKKRLVEGEVEYKDKNSKYIFYTDYESDSLYSVNIITGKKIEYDVELSCFIKATEDYVYYGIIDKNTTYASNTEPIYTRYRINVDGTEKQKLDNEYIPHLAANNNKLFYNRIEMSETKTVYRLYESNFDGTNEKFLLNNSMRGGCVSADKDYLYYNTRDTEYGNVVKRMNIATSKLELIAETDKDNGRICCTDDENIYVRNDKGQISSINKFTFKKKYIFYGNSVLAIPEKFSTTIQEGYFYLSSTDENYRRKLFDDNTVGKLEAI